MIMFGTVYFIFGNSIKKSYADDETGGAGDDITATVEHTGTVGSAAAPIRAISEEKFRSMYPNDDNVIKLTPVDPNNSSNTTNSDRPDVLGIYVTVSNQDIDPQVDISGVTWTSPLSVFAAGASIGSNNGSIAFLVPCNATGTLAIHYIYPNGITGDYSAQIACPSLISFYSVGLADLRALHVNITNQNIQPYFLLNAVDYTDSPLPNFHESVTGPDSYLYVNDTHSVTMGCDQENFPNPNTISYTYTMGGTNHIRSVSNSLCGDTINIRLNSSLFPTPTSGPTPTPTPPNCPSPQSVQTNCGPNGDGWQSCYFSWNGSQCVRGSCVLPCFY